MGIAADAPRGGAIVTFDGRSRPALLRNAEIERFEDQHRGIFAVWDGFFGRGTRPTSREVRDLIALGLVGGGMADSAADSLVAEMGPSENLNFYHIARGLLGVAFYPDADQEAPQSETASADDKKKATADGA